MIQQTTTATVTKESASTAPQEVLLEAANNYALDVGAFAEAMLCNTSQEVCTHNQIDTSWNEMNQDIEIDSWVIAQLNTIC